MSSNSSTSLVDSDSSTSLVDSDSSTSLVDSDSSTSLVESDSLTCLVDSNSSTSLVASNLPVNLVSSNSSKNPVASNSSVVPADSNSTTAITSSNNIASLSFSNTLRSSSDQTVETESQFSNSLNRIPYTEVKGLNSTTNTSPFRNTSSTALPLSNSSTTNFTFSNPITNAFAFSNSSNSTATITSPNANTTKFTFSNPITNAFAFSNSSNSTATITSPNDNTTKFTFSSQITNAFTYTKSSNSTADPNTVSTFSFPNSAKRFTNKTAKKSFRKKFSETLDILTLELLTPISTNFTPSTPSLSDKTTTTSSWLNSTTIPFTFPCLTTTTLTFSFASTPVSSNWKPSFSFSNANPNEFKFSAERTSGTAEETKDCKISLIELPRKTFLSVRYMIKIPNFFTKDEYDDAGYKSSPIFEFAYASWQFRFESRKLRKNKDDEWVKEFKIFLKRLNCVGRHAIFHNITLLDANDQIYSDRSSLKNFRYFSDGEVIGWFDNDCRSFDKRDTLTLYIHLICDEWPKVNAVQEPFPTNRGIIEATQNTEISLSEMPQKNFSSVNYLMKVPNFFTMPENKNTKFKSPSFEFASATWQFDIKSERKYQENEDKWITEIYVCLGRLNCGIRKQLLFYNVSLLDENDKNYDISHGSKTFSKEKNILYIKPFSNSSASYDERVTLTLKLHLICEDSPEVNAVQGVLLSNKVMLTKKISLSELPRKRLSSVNYVMKVPNFFTLPDYHDTEFKINSPSFEFVNATWQFVFESDETPAADICNKKFKVSLVRLSSKERNHSITYIISLLDGSDENYDEYRSGTVYKEDFNVHHMCTFNNQKSSYDKRDNLTFIFQLFCDESTEVNAIQELHSTNRGKYLRQDFKEVFLNGENHDITFNVQGKEFQAHQDILKARSEVFRSMLSHDMLEKNCGNINVPDCIPEAFAQLLLYIYTGNVESLDENNMFGLYYAADKYDMASLKEVCKEFIKNSLSVTNICEVISLASKHSDANLLDCAISYFINNADEIFPTVKWQMFLEENPTVANELIIKSFKRLKLKSSA